MHNDIAKDVDGIGNGVDPERNTISGTVCANCEEDELSVFYRRERLPVHSVVLLRTREEALDYPTGDIALGFCPNCGFISNILHDPTLLDYSDDYESTQTYSQTYDAFALQIAQDLVDRYTLHGKTILEIGCGQGEFLRLLCDLGRNKGIGYDPAYIERDENGATNGQITFIKDYFSEKYAGQKADLVVCKMTLEHIHEPLKFINMVRGAIGRHWDTSVFIQVPDVTRILRELAFWDIYYEHCSYFSPTSLSRLFRRCGFHVLHLSKKYGDQYLLLEAKPNKGDSPAQDAPENDFQRLKRDVSYFSMNSNRRISEWKRSISDLRLSGQRIVLWGGGSKAVAFLTTLGIAEEIEYAVDINPKKGGTFIAGAGQRVVNPEFLREYNPDTVIVMNSIYLSEIEKQLRTLGLAPELISV